MFKISPMFFCFRHQFLAGTISKISDNNNSEMFCLDLHILIQVILITTLLITPQLGNLPSIYFMIFTVKLWGLFY